MPRQPRFWYPGSVIHAVQRGNDRAAMFVDDDDRRFFLACTSDAARQYGVAIHAYVLMSNHVHLLASPGSADAMPRMMQKIGRRFVGRFNFRHGRTGPLWEGRYRATLIDGDAHLVACMRYIELNPVRAGMVASPARFPWSSHRANALGKADALVTPHALYEALGATPEARRDRYRAEVMQAPGEDELRAIRDATQHEWVLGGSAFRQRVEEVTGRRAGRLPKGPRGHGVRSRRGAAT